MEQESYSIAATSMRKLHTRTKILGFFVGCILALAGLAVFVFWGNPSALFSTWSAYTLPPELKKVVVLSKLDSTLITRIPGPVWYQTQSYEGGESASVIRDAESTFVVRKTSEGFFLEDNGMVRIQSPNQIAAPSRARTTKQILFAVPTSVAKNSTDPVRSSVTQIHPADWEVHLYSPTTGKDALIIGGYAPLFIDDTHFLFFTTSGVYRYDLKSGEAQKVIDHQITVVFAPVIQSPDHSLIAFTDPVKKMTLVYKVQSTEVKLVMEVPEILVSPALSNDALYAVRGTLQGGQVWKYPLGISKPELIYTFPRSLGVKRIVF